MTYSDELEPVAELDLAIFGEGCFALRVRGDLSHVLPGVADGDCLVFGRGRRVDSLMLVIIDESLNWQVTLFPQHGERVIGRLVGMVRVPKQGDAHGETDEPGQ
jgi:hypothetical protein